MNGFECFGHFFSRETRILNSRPMHATKKLRKLRAERAARVPDAKPVRVVNSDLVEQRGGALALIRAERMEDGGKPGLVGAATVWVKSNSRELYRDFHRHCEARGITLQPVGEACGKGRYATFVATHPLGMPIVELVDSPPECIINAVFLTRVQCGGSTGKLGKPVQPGAYKAKHKPGTDNTSDLRGECAVGMQAGMEHVSTKLAAMRS